MPPRGTADGAQPAPPSAVGSLEGWPQRRARVPWAPAGFPCRLHGTAAALVAQHPAATVPKIAAAGRADTARHRIDDARRAERKIDQHYCTIRKSAGPRILRRAIQLSRSSDPAQLRRDSSRGSQYSLGFSPHSYRWVARVSTLLSFRRLLALQCRPSPRRMPRTRCAPSST